jgi:hypothetical protein
VRRPRASSKRVFGVVQQRHDGFGQTAVTQYSYSLDAEKTEDAIKMVDPIGCATSKRP